MATSYKRLSFSNDEEYKLIEFIKNHPALWDASDEYGNSESRKIYWMALAEDLHKPVSECRRKWRFVRDYYIHKRRRHSGSTPQRDGKYFSLQFLNKVKVSSKKFPSIPDEMGQKKIKNKTNITKHLNKEDYIDSDEIDYDYSEDPTFEKIIVERVVGNEPKCLPDTDLSLQVLQHQDQDTNDDKSEDLFYKEDYIDESSMNEDFDKIQKIEEISDARDEQEQEEEHLMDASNESATSEQITKQTDNTLLHEKAIDLFFESMAATVKTFPAQYVTEAKCNVFMAINEIEAKVFKNVNKN